jgi:DNA replication and repair protein RecF
MLFCESLSLFQFRNFTQSHFNFSERTIAIAGNNGVGKTNLLDAIYYLSFTKSAMGRSDILSVKQGCKGWRLDGQFSKKSITSHVTCLMRENNRKELQCNNTTVSRFSDHIGQLPMIFISPDEIVLINEGSAERRRFIDLLLCQIDPVYMSNLSLFQKILEQRNKHLVLLSERISTDFSLLEVLDIQLSEAGNYVFRKRKEFLPDFFSLTTAGYEKIVGAIETVKCTYASQQNDDQLDILLQKYRQKDLLSRRTSAGPHRDDILVEMGGFEFKQTASQGQRKSLLFAFKLAAIQLLTRHFGYAPILLLDDIFEKLDNKRVVELLSAMYQTGAQLFITDTDADRLLSVLNKMGAPLQLILPDNR